MRIPFGSGGLLLLGLLLSMSSFALENLSFYTEEYPPYNYRADGELKGIAVELLVAASKKVGHPVKRESVKLRPWPRAYRTVLSVPDTVLFSMARTRMREELFLWAGPIEQTRVVMMARKDRGIVINGPDEMARYRVGVILDDVGEQLALEAGASSELLERATSAVALAKMLKLGRIDIWAYEENVARWSMTKAGLDDSKYEVVYVLNRLEMYYAFHRDTDPELVELLQKGIDLTKQPEAETGKSEYQRIMEKYQSVPFAQ